MQKPENSIIVIFGASGDLTKRKLMPALFDLYLRDLLPEQFAVVGTGRTNFSDESFRESMEGSLKQFYKNTGVSDDFRGKFLKNIYYTVADSKNLDDFKKLKSKLTQLDSDYQSEGNFIYYLSTTPSLFGTIGDNLAKVGLNKQDEDHGRKRIVLEKPFGYNLNTAKELNRKLLKNFDERQIYRIDHYLGKETVQNILALRFANGIFEPLWNRNYIHHIEITAAESIGVEKRGKYYNGAGALRDMVQNHLLQVVATIAMEPPVKFEANSVRNEKVKNFQALCPIKMENVPRQVVRGQYVSSKINGDQIAGYREEENVPSDSRTETFVAMKFFIDNWRWGDVPFHIRTGKRLPDRVTEVVIHFKKTPHSLFKKESECQITDNQLIIRIQPDEGISLKFGMKVPGAGFNIQAVDMDFHYADLGGKSLPEAYERLLLDCLLGDPTLYARADAVEACWEFITPILDAWEKNPDIELYGYPAGSWGPKEAGNLIDEADEDWHFPCESKTEDKGYCKL